MVEDINAKVQKLFIELERLCQQEEYKKILLTCDKSNIYYTNFYIIFYIFFILLFHFNVVNIKNQIYTMFIS